MTELCSRKCDNGELRLQMCSDEDWAEDLIVRHSTFGYCLSLKEQLTVEQ